jgi:hypothetical protein
MIATSLRLGSSNLARVGFLARLYGRPGSMSLTGSPIERKESGPPRSASDV